MTLQAQIDRRLQRLAAQSRRFSDHPDEKKPPKPRPFPKPR